MTQTESLATAATVAIKRYEAAREKYAEMVAREMELQEQRPIAKDAAIRSLMPPTEHEPKGLTYTAAERLVETVPEYANLLRALRVVVVDKERHFASAEAARMQHTLSVELLRLVPIEAGVA